MRRLACLVILTALVAAAPADHATARQGGFAISTPFTYWIHQGHQRSCFLGIRLSGYWPSGKLMTYRLAARFARWPRQRPGFFVDPVLEGGFTSQHPDGHFSVRAPRPLFTFGAETAQYDRRVLFRWFHSHSTATLTARATVRNSRNRVVWRHAQTFQLATSALKACTYNHRQSEAKLYDTEDPRWPVKPAR